MFTHILGRPTGLLHHTNAALDTLEALVLHVNVSFVLNVNKYRVLDLRYNQETIIYRICYISIVKF